MYTEMAALYLQLAMLDVWSLAIAPDRIVAVLGGALRGAETATFRKILKGEKGEEKQGSCFKKKYEKQKTLFFFKVAYIDDF